MGMFSPTNGMNQQNDQGIGGMQDQNQPAPQITPYHVQQSPQLNVNPMQLAQGMKNMYARYQAYQAAQHPQNTPGVGTGPTSGGPTSNQMDASTNAGYGDPNYVSPSALAQQMGNDPNAMSAQDQSGLGASPSASDLANGLQQNGMMTGFGGGPSAGGGLGLMDS